MKYAGPLRGGAKGRGAQARNFRSSGGDKNGILYAQLLDYTGVPHGDRVQFFNAMRVANVKLAEELQQLVAAKLASGRVPSRRGVSSGRLEGAILDSRNRAKPSPFVMGVGVKKWMDQSQAKWYWRGIEVGTPQFVGNQIQAHWLWGSTLGGGYGGTSRFGYYPLATAPFTGSAQGRGGRLRPMGRSYAYRMLRDQGMKASAAFAIAGGPRSRRQPIIIRNPIRAEYYYRRAWREFDGRARGRAALLTALREAGITGPPR